MVGVNSVLIEVVAVSLGLLANIALLYVRWEAKRRGTTEEHVSSIESELSAVTDQVNTLQRILMGRRYGETSFEESGLVSQISEINETLKRVDGRLEQLERGQKRDLARVYERLVEEGIVDESNIPPDVDKYRTDGKGDR